MSFHYLCKASQCTLCKNALQILLSVSHLLFSHKHLFLVLSCHFQPTQHVNLRRVCLIGLIV